MKALTIRENVPAYMDALRKWLLDSANTPLEEMAAFFSARLTDYEEHMAVWREAYRALPALLPAGAETLLDLGCGTGLELDEILKARPTLAVTGVDLSSDMLARLKQKHPGVRAVQGDYFSCELGRACYDAAVSVESLHHFPAERKGKLFTRVLAALKPGGVFLEADYLACCAEEETLLARESARRRAAQGIGPDAFVHFDTPLTARRERALLTGAGFAEVKLVCCVEGACILTARRPEP